MSDNKKKTAPVSAPPVLGKQWRGQHFAPIHTEASLQSIADEQLPYKKDGAIPLAAYLAHKGIRDPVRVAGMRAYTVVREATIEDWNTIFVNY